MFQEQSDIGGIEMKLATGGGLANLKVYPGFIEGVNNPFIVRSGAGAYIAAGLGIGGFVSWSIGSFGAWITK